MAKLIFSFLPTFLLKHPIRKLKQKMAEQASQRSGLLCIEKKTF
jgi:hypothetical protein